ncbi:uncharacterized protein LAJ45_00306 [Morchella importuna]|uniref:uncharacterized protein n=1 Tax=Morchella importuna TaxID=1174673 RepID=UPI001E8E93A8|nr:uncharacterized protein LAJ45_00306 [Morchella importuna]KAH8155296.1 hypothetical protein LAJ45_00306 [Morchella importuna]
MHSEDSVSQVLPRLLFDAKDNDSRESCHRAPTTTLRVPLQLCPSFFNNQFDRLPFSFDQEEGNKTNTF